jgi:hypothetical protein
VALATHLALASPLVTTDVIMLNLFPYMAVRYHADDVPTTVVNGTKTLVGTCEEGEAVAKILAAVARTSSLPVP